MVEGSGLGPSAAQQPGVLVGAAVAGGVVDVVPVAGLVGVVTAGDEVHRQSSAAELVERGQLAGGDGRRDEPRPVGEQEAQPLGAGRAVGGDEEPVGRVGEVADENLVETRGLVDPSGVGDDRGVEGIAFGADDFGADPGRDPADEFGSHCRSRQNTITWRVTSPRFMAA